MEKPEQKIRAAQHPPTWIVVERIYLGGQFMEDAFRYGTFYLAYDAADEFV